MKTILSICAVATLVACTATPTTNTSQQPEPQSAQHEQAKAIFDQGLAAYNAQDYATALPLFRQAATQGFSDWRI